MTLEDRLMEERDGDEGLDEAEEHREDPEEVKRKPEKVKVHNGPTGVPASVAGEGEEELVKDGIFEDKLEKSQETGGYGRGRRRKGRVSDGKIHKSQRKQRTGLLVEGEYALVRCNRSKGRYSHGCHGLMIVERGQKTATCPKCGRRRWLTDTNVIDTSDNENFLENKKSEMLA